MIFTDNIVKLFFENLWVYLKDKEQNASLSLNSYSSTEQRGINITCLAEGIIKYEKSKLLILTQNTFQREKGKGHYAADQETDQLFLLLDRIEP